MDTIWLNMDRPNNLMVIDALMFFDQPVDWDRVTRVLQRRLVRNFPVFRQRPVDPVLPLAMPRWQDDEDSTIEQHIHRARLPAPGDDELLQRYVERFMHEPLPRDRPLWQAHFIDGYRDGAALFMRFHHALSDGIALARVMMSMTDDTPDGDLAEAGRLAMLALADGRPADRRSGPAARAVSAAGSVAVGAVSAVTHLVAAVPHAAAGVPRVVAEVPGLARPERVGALLVQAHRTVRIVDKLVLRHNPATVLSGEPGVPKRAVWSEPFPLSDIKHIGRLAGATVNDVLMGAVAGAICTYLQDQGESATDLTTMVPVNVRRLDQPLPPELGNQFALVMLPLPSGMPQPLARLAEAKRRMDVIKHSPEVLLTFGLITAIGRTGKRLERLLVNFFADKAIGVTTNVAGPGTPRYLAGSKVSGVLAWVPCSGRQTVGICIVSYNQSVRVGFKVDAATVRQPEKLLHAFDREIDELTRLAHAV